ncbi:hypothetical protein [Acuticoccus sediminis]|uniref:hypothetical protein n=1 Tax=Acuticoccus sediminis TaxID=2184697 RepID=UPI001CFECD6C|nr:hypothetical protein [Acuticoccus sediminis]
MDEQTPDEVSGARAIRARVDALTVALASLTRCLGKTSSLDVDAFVSELNGIAEALAANGDRTIQEKMQEVVELIQRE